MRRFTELTLTAVVAATIGAGAASLRPASAAGPTPAGPKWEHHVELCSVAEFKDSDEYKALEKETGNPWRAQFAFQERVLNRAGMEGFQLVQVLMPKSPAECILYLRRPIQ